MASEDVRSAATFRMALDLVATHRADLAATLVFAFVSPALAEQFYVVFDPASKKCEAMHEIPKGMKSMGTYGSMDEAKKAMSSMKECG
jgi:hypothetical protein